MPISKFKGRFLELTGYSTLPHPQPKVTTLGVGWVHHVPTETGSELNQVSNIPENFLS